jgi:hypothetical protein
MQQFPNALFIGLDLVRATRRATEGVAAAPNAPTSSPARLHRAGGPYLKLFSRHFWYHPQNR